MDLRALSIASLFLACGPPASGVWSDGDATTHDGPTSTDGSLDATDAPKPQVDPAHCPIGPADGCCPLLANGGTDVDCRDFDCALPVASTVIDLPLEDDPTRWKGATGIAWTGRELMLAHTRTTPGSPSYGREIVVERRDPAGVLIADRRTVEPSAVPRSIPGNAALAFDPTSTNLLYAYTGIYQSNVIGLSREGEVLWGAAAAGACGPNTPIVAFGGRNRVLFAGANGACTTNGNYPYLASYEPSSGTRHFGLATSTDPFFDYSYDVAATCGLDCDTVQLQWDQQGEVRTRTIVPGFAPMSPMLQPVRAMAPELDGVDFTTAASNGNETLSVIGYRATNASTRIRVQRWSGSAWIGEAETFGGPRVWLPTTVWTGDGWLMAGSTFAGDGPYADNHDEFSIELWHFDAEGKLRRHWVFEPHAYLPKLAWAGGRVAMTFVRAPDATSPETRHLVLFECF